MVSVSSAKLTVPGLHRIAEREDVLCTPQIESRISLLQNSSGTFNVAQRWNDNAESIVRSVVRLVLILSRRCFMYMTLSTASAAERSSAILILLATLCANLEIQFMGCVVLSILLVKSIFSLNLVLVSFSLIESF